MPILTLIQVKACLVAFADIHKKATGTFFDLEEFGWRLSPKSARAELKAFLETHVDIRSLIDACRRKHLLKLKNDLVFPVIRSSVQELADEVLAVFVHHQARKAV
jgi:hypothetical protein